MNDTESGLSLTFRERGNWTSGNVGRGVPGTRTQLGARAGVRGSPGLAQQRVRRSRVAEERPDLDRGASGYPSAGVPGPRPSNQWLTVAVTFPLATYLAIPALFFNTCRCLMIVLSGQGQLVAKPYDVDSCGAPLHFTPLITWGQIDQA